MAIKQTVRPPAVKDRDGLHSLTAWNGSAGPMVYAWPSGGQLYAYGVANGQLSLKSMVGLKASHPGGTVTISSNGTMPNTGVAWATIARTGDSWHGTAIGTLFAYDAVDVSKELWNSDDDMNDNLESYAKFSPPLVANGKVYVASFSGKIKVYGLKK
jgi:outer membrane protein assembly factor BamB